MVSLLAALLRVQAAGGLSPEIPFEFQEGLLWLKGVLPQSAKPLNLLLDTGAGVSVINAGIARRLGLKGGREVPVRGVESTLTGRWLEPLSITAAGVQLPAKYLAVDLDKLSRSCQRPVDGLVGMDFFRGRRVEIDFDRRVIRILSSPHTVAPGDALPLDLRPWGMCIPIRVNGRERQWVRLDTGCASALEWVTMKVPADPGTPRTAIGLAEVSIPQAQTVVNLGACQFQNVPTGMHQRPIFEGEAGLLGNGLLSRFSRLTLDAESGRLFLGPRAAVP